MSPLVTPAMLNKLRSVGNRQLITDVTIQRKSKIETTYGTDEIWTTVSVTKGWLRNMNLPAMAQLTGIIGALTIYRLHLTMGTDVREGDQVVIGGEIFLVQNVNQEDSIQIFTTADLRKIQ